MENRTGSNLTILAISGACAILVGNHSFSVFLLFVTHVVRAATVTAAVTLAAMRL